MFTKRVKKILLSLLIISTSSCNKDYYTVGIEIYDNQFEDLKSKSFPVFSYQEYFEKVQTNLTSNVHLGVYNDDFFGQINSSFISQLDVSSLQSFGAFSQDQENEGSTEDIRVINEQEQVTAVYLDLPFFNNTIDSDNDGVIDLYDADPNDSSSDSDNDGLSDIVELQSGTNPLSQDTDNDGILDPQDTEITGYNLNSQVYEIDSLFGNRNAEFRLKVYELTYFLNSLDPSNNFESIKEYFSNDDFYEEGFYGREFHNDIISLNFDEIPVLYFEDDPLTDDVNELNEVNYFETPRIRVPLEKEFFQREILDKEGTDDLTNQLNFNNYFKGLIIRADSFSDDLYMLLDILNARIVIEYSYNYYNGNGTDDVLDDVIERKKKSTVIPLGGVTINLYNQNGYNQEIINEINSSAESIPSKMIYLNGTKFFSKLKLFSEDNSISPDLNTLKSKNILVNEANLMLYIDENIHRSKYEYLPKRLYLYSYDDGEPIEDYQKDFTIDYNQASVNSNKYYYGGLLQYDSNNKPIGYKFNVTNHVSNIIIHDSINIDLGLTLTSDIENNFLRSGYLTSSKRLRIPDASVSLPFPVALFGSNPKQQDLSKKLKLEILYTEY
ncbi:MAG: DUF4270 family protein [Bacteroidetes bacterium]|nr:DUF4270 domain-containing protein [Cryomorphaceae bacterium]MBL6677594.1 DUF4270 domain-containing protein [Flavobacteriaceae bacterium]MDA0331174.1 DUF4270 family protein [Bacteroidota bacterium]MDA0885241.1 DUF4270 family protein [Bacteroidota bacterium]MDA1225867.1 DUF4270 family protein [Bacteroidota bacterium]